MQPKDKFRKETRYPHHRSDGLHPKRARRLMRKVAPDHMNSANYLQVICSLFTSTNGGPMLCESCGSEFTGQQQMCLPPIPPWSTPTELYDDVVPNSLPPSFRAHIYERRVNDEGQSFMHCEGCGRLWTEDGPMGGELGCPG